MKFSEIKAAISKVLDSMRRRGHYAPFIAIEKKKVEYYKGIRQKTDSLLHEQLDLYIRKAFCGRKISILDWGCGEGALSERLSDEGHSVVAVDIDASAWKGNSARFIVLDFNQKENVSSFVNKFRKRFDLVIMVEVIEHIKSPWEVFHQLRKLDADIIITTPNVSSWWGRLWFLITGDLWSFSSREWSDPGHINPISYVEMVNMLQAIGFEIKSVFPGGRLPIIWFYNLKTVLISISMLMIRPFMRGYKDGWALCYHIIPDGKSSTEQ